MADKLNSTGLAYFFNRLKVIFASSDDLDALSDRVDDIIAEGGEPNVIETVKVNGTALTPVNKAVDVIVPEDLSDLTNTGNDPYAQQSDIPTKVSDLTNDGDGTSGSHFATEAYVDQNGGKIDKIKVNSVEQTITNKTVDITVPTDVSDLTDSSGVIPDDISDLTDSTGIIPTDLSDLTNTSADPYVTESEVDSKVVGALKPKGSIAFASLPALTAANLNNMYNITDAFTTTADFVEGAGKSYPAGTNVAIINVGTDASPTYKYDAMTGIVDLSGYWSKAELTAITTAQIDAIIDGN